MIEERPEAGPWAPKGKRVGRSHRKGTESTRRAVGEAGAQGLPRQPRGRREVRGKHS